MSTLVGVICLLLFFIFSKKGLALFFQVALIIVVLFFLNIILNNIGVSIPINLFTVIVIALLKLPGAICIGMLMILKVFL